MRPGDAYRVCQRAISSRPVSPDGKIRKQKANGGLRDDRAPSQDVHANTSGVEGRL